MENPSNSSKPRPTGNLRRIVINTVSGVVILAAIFVAAGSLRWPHFWIFLGFYVATTTAFLLWLKKRDPGLLKERTSPGVGVKRWDKIIIRFYSILLLVVFFVAALDAVRFRWSRVPPFVQWSAFAGIVAAGAIVLWSFRENAFLSGFVRIQAERGHAVCSAGPYRIVRHPMYLAVILVALLVPLFLGSLFALIPAAMTAGLFVLRTALEDRTLQNELPGYAEYAERVRWKLIPRLW